MRTLRQPYGEFHMEKKRGLLPIASTYSLAIGLTTLIDEAPDPVKP